MPEANQYVFSQTEMLEMLIKQSGVHEGKWVLMINFGISTGGFQMPDQAHPSPGAIVVVGQIGIQRHPEGAQADPKALILDAAVVNPKS